MKRILLSMISAFAVFAESALAQESPPEAASREKVYEADRFSPYASRISHLQRSGAPTFMVYALRDPIAGNLGRIQIIKGWLDEKGKTHERIYDVAVSDGRRIGADGRCKTLIGNTVDVKTASFTNTIGASELGTVWTDPDFSTKQKAVYYARVIEIPTPRSSTIDAFRFGVPIPKGAPVSTQERAYTSPIWYTP